jgi:hypothetical protein
MEWEKCRERVRNGGTQSGRPSYNRKREMGKEGNDFSKGRALQEIMGDVYFNYKQARAYAF